MKRVMTVLAPLLFILLPLLALYAAGASVAAFVEWHPILWYPADWHEASRAMFAVVAVFWTGVVLIVVSESL